MAYIDADLGVIKDARRRQRHRRYLVAALLLTAALGASVVWTDTHDTGIPPAARHSSSPPPPQAVAVSPQIAFWRPPYMGVACPTPNSVACDRVGLALWLRRPAVRVTATLEGTTLRLWTGEHSPSAWTSRPNRTGFAVYLQPAGILTSLSITPRPGTSTWYGKPTTAPLVAFRIDYGEGNIVATKQRVPLMAGWG